ncbi:MAG: hypothetical protein MUF42_06415 [Cytophagaceae bacterium]|jgi:hypothetical protein|nr:hypothetical protein [Cytophagaceae bacterium]
MDILEQALTLELKACRHDLDKVMQFFSRKPLTKREEESFVRFALQYLYQLEEQDSYSVIAGLLRWLHDYGTPDILPELEKIKPILPPRKGLRDYRIDASELIAHLQKKAAGICECKNKIDFGTSPHIDMFEIVSCVVHSEEYYSEYVVRCKRCSSEYKGREEEGYHYPVYRWN